MIKSYKTSRRRVGVVRPPSDPTTTDSAAMSFLDDMLGGPSTSAVTSSIGQQQQQQQQAAASGAIRTPTSPAVNVSNDIDEILELVSGGSGGGGGGGASKQDHSNNSGSRKRMGGAATAHDSKWSDPVFSPPSATTTTTTTTTTRRGRGNHDTGGRPSSSSSKSPLRRSGVGPRGSFHSSDGLPMMEETTTTPSPPAHHLHPHHHLTDPPATTTMRLTDSSSPSHRPNHNGGRQRAATKEEEEEAEAVGNNQHHKNDNVPPIPFFNTNHNGHDDETISQITTSVASNSFYDSQYGDSRNSGSYSWLRNNNNNNNSKQPTRPTSQGDMSFADTLDEIADMLGPKSPRTAQDHQPPFGRSRSGGNNEDPLGLRGNNSNSNSNHMRSKSPNDLFRSRSGGNLQSKPTMTSTTTPTAHRSAFDADEIYKRSKRNTGRMSSSSSRTLLDMVEPTLGQLRLHLRYVMTLVVPKDFWKRESKKEDTEEGGGGGGGEADYFNAIMRSNNNNNNPSSSARKPHHHPHPHHGRGGRKRGALGYTLHLFGLFCFLTVVILLMRLAAMHTTQSSIKGGRGTRGGVGGKRKRGRNKQHLHTGDVRGHMAIRDSSGAAGGGGGSSMVRGGMAHHSMGEVNGGFPQAPVTDQALEDLQHDERPGQQLQHKNFQHEEHLGMRLPSAFDYLADITDLPVQKGVDIPFFWHIPRTGGGTINDIFGGCMSLTLASDAGGAGAAGQEHVSIASFLKQTHTHS